MCVTEVHIPFSCFTLFLPLFLSPPALDLWAIVSFSDCFWKGFMAARAHSIQQITHFTMFIYFISWVFFIFCTSLTLHYSNLKYSNLHTGLKRKVFYLLLVWNVDFTSSGPLFIYLIFFCQHSMKNSERQLHIKLKANLQVLFFGILDFYLEAEGQNNWPDDFPCGSVFSASVIEWISVGENVFWYFCIRCFAFSNFIFLLIFLAV